MGQQGRGFEVFGLTFRLSSAMSKGHFRAKVKPTIN